MTPIDSFFLPGAHVQPKQADRQRIGYTKGGKAFIIHHPSQKVVDNAKELTGMLRAHIPLFPYSGPLVVQYTVVYPWRKAEPKKNRVGLVPKHTQPDPDQLAKQLSDVLEKAGFWANDGQISTLVVKKRWGDPSGIGVKIWTDGPDGG